MQRSSDAPARAAAAPMRTSATPPARVAPGWHKQRGKSMAPHRGCRARAQRRRHAHAAQQRAGQATRVLHGCLRRVQGRVSGGRRAALVPQTTTARCTAPTEPLAARQGRRTRVRTVEAARRGRTVTAHGPRGGAQVDSALLRGAGVGAPLTQRRAREARLGRGRVAPEARARHGRRQKPAGTSLALPAQERARRARSRVVVRTAHTIASPSSWCTEGAARLDFVRRPARE